MEPVMLLARETIHELDENYSIKSSPNILKIKKFRSLVNKYLKSFEEIVSNYQKANNEKEISQFLDSESGVLFFLVSHLIGKLD